MSISSCNNVYKNSSLSNNRPVHDIERPLVYRKWTSFINYRRGPTYAVCAGCPRSKLFAGAFSHLSTEHALRDLITDRLMLNTVLNLFSVALPGKHMSTRVIQKVLSLTKKGWHNRDRLFQNWRRGRCDLRFGNK